MTSTFARLRESHSLAVPDDEIASPEVHVRYSCRSVDSNETEMTDASPLNAIDRMRRYATRWPARVGALELRGAAGEDAYEQYCAGELWEEDFDQIAADLDRSSVDDLPTLAPPDFDEQQHRAKLGRVLHAFCVRTPRGYCQGMNFVVAVLLVVLEHGEGTARLSRSPPSTPNAPRSTPPSEELAFWTFVAMMERLLPLDFYQMPTMAGLQCDVRVLMQLLRTEVPELFAPGISEEELAAVVKLAAYKWLVPCFVNQLPLNTLLHFWDRLLLRLPPAAAGQTVSRHGYSAAHLQLSLALLHGSAEDVAATLQAHPNEAMGLGFEMLLRDALSRHNAIPLIARASSYDLSVDQLIYLRRKLRHGTARGHIDPTLNGLQTATLSLLHAQRSPWRLVRILQEVVLLAPPPAPPIESLARLPQHYPRLVYACALTFAACCVWCIRTASPSSRRGVVVTQPV